MTKPEFTPISSVEIFRYLYQKKIQLFLIPFVSSLIIAIATLFIDNEYKAQANLLPSKAPSIGFSLFSETGGISNLASSFLGGGSEEANKYYVLLQSNSTSRMVVERFDLVNVYETSQSEFPIIYAIEELNNNTTFESREEGNFIINVWDKNPTRAKEIAEYYIELLNTRNANISTLEAKNYREFIEQRYFTSLSTIDSLRASLVEIQQQYGVIELPTQIENYFSVIAGLTAEKYLAEIQLEVLANTLQPESQNYKAAQGEVEIISQKLEESYRDTSKTNIILNFKELPEIASKYYDTVMNLEIELEIQKFIVPIYEQAKMEEAKALPIVSVVDAPIISERKDKPRRAIIVISAGVSILILVIFFYIVELNFMINKEFYSYLTNK